jgi:4-aminobutyrate aminotransferase
MAQHATGKRDTITMFRSHHGQTFATTSMSGHAFRREPFPYVFPGSLQVPDAYCRRCFYRQRPDTCRRLCVDRIEDFVDYASSGSVACVVVEPISGAGGNIVPPEGYFERLRELCDRLGMVLIFDEIQTGIGRTGKMFASQHFGVEPDAITVAKGLGGSGMQIAAILTNDKLMGLELEHHAFTYGGNVLAAAVADKVLQIMQRPGFLESVCNVGQHVMERMRSSQRRHPFIFDVRGVGLMIGVEIARSDGRPDPHLTHRLVELGRHQGLLLRTSEWGRGNVVKIRPPLIMSHEEAADMCDRLDRVFALSER